MDDQGGTHGSGAAVPARGARARDPAGADDAVARIAHQYYVLGLTQGEIARRMGITRFKAHRMLARAREAGVVRIEIDVSSGRRLALEDALTARFGLRSAFVCPSDATEELPIAGVIGHYAAGVVAPMIAEGMTIAVSWGRTLRALAESIEPASGRGLSVVPLIGSLSKRSTIDRYEASSALAWRLGAECYYLPGPIICDDLETKIAIDAQTTLRQTLDRARAADLALLSIGGRAFSSLVAAGCITEAERDDVAARGAVGNLLGRFVGADGRPVDHPLNARAIGLPPAEIAGIPARVLCAGGPRKSDAIAAALASGAATALVTDEATAEAVLAI